MTEKYTPSERLEAADKAKQHEKGREQAKFYLYFLELLQDKIVGQLLRKDINKGLGEIDINNTDLPLKKFQFCDLESIIRYIGESEQAANRALGTSETVETNPTELAEMTPREFYRYINNLKDSLIKE